MNAIPSAPVPSLPVDPNGAVRAAAEDRFILAYGDTLRILSTPERKCIGVPE